MVRGANRYFAISRGTIVSAWRLSREGFCGSFVLAGVSFAATLILLAVILLNVTGKPTFTYTVPVEQIAVCEGEPLTIPVEGKASGRVGAVTITQDITQLNGVSIDPTGALFPPLERPTGLEREPFDFAFTFSLDLEPFDLARGEYIYHRVSRIVTKDGATVAAGYGVRFVIEACQ